jgi:hypothetical protein
MTAAPDPSQRLIAVERMLAQVKNSSLPDSDDLVPLLLAAVPIERLSPLTSALKQTHDAPLDEIDAITARLLLNDYSLAVAHLRAVTRVVAKRVDAAAGPVNESRKRVDKEIRKRAKLLQPKGSSR